MRVMLFMVPTRIVRVVATDETLKTFRVEQLIITGDDAISPRGNWTTLSTHGSEVPGQSFKPAVDAAHEAQKNLIRKLNRRIEKKRLVRP